MFYKQYFLRDTKDIFARISLLKQKSRFFLEKSKKASSHLRADF